MMNKFVEVAVLEVEKDNKEIRFELIKEYPDSYPVGFIISNIRPAGPLRNICSSDKCWNSEDKYTHVDGYIGYPAFEIEWLRKYPEFWKEIK